MKWNGYKSFAEEMSVLFLFEPFDEQAKQYIDSEFRRRYPGNYDISWDLSDSTNLIEYDIKFHTPEDEVMFALKYL